MKTAAPKNQIKETIKKVSGKADEKKRGVTNIARKKVRDAVNHFLSKEEEEEIAQKPGFRDIFFQKARKAAPIIIPLALGAVTGILLTRGNTLRRLASLVKMGGRITAVAQMAPEVIAVTGMRPAVNKVLEKMATFMKDRNLPMPKMA